MRGAGKAGRGRGAGVSRRGPAPSLTIRPNQSGEIRLTANLLDTRRRFAPPAKNGGYGEGKSGGGTGTAKRGDSPGGESLDTRRRQSRRQRKMAGSGRLGGHREKDGGKRNGYGQAGEIRLTANLWIRGDASRRQRKMAGSGRNGGYKGKGWREAERVRRSGGDSPGGESLDTRRRQSRRQRRSAGSEGIAKRRNENGQEERGRWEAKSLASRGNASG